MGAFAPNPGSGVKAVPAIWRGLAGLMVRWGSLSCSISALSDRGIMLITSTPPFASLKGRPGAAPSPLDCDLLIVLCAAMLHSLLKLSTSHANSVPISTRSGVNHVSYPTGLIEGLKVRGIEGRIADRGFFT